MKKYIKYIIAVLLLIPCACFGDITSALQNLTFNPPIGDMSVAFLAQLFGVVPGVPQLMQAGHTILGSLFFVFNTGLLALSGVFLSFTTFKIVTETTTDGSAMKHATMWTAVRVGMGASLLVPQATGYSTINTFIMWIIIQSVGLADLTWDTALGYLKSGAPMTSSNDTSKVDYSLVNYDLVDPAAGVANVGSADVLRCLVCAYTVKDAFERKEASSLRHLSSISKFSVYHMTDHTCVPSSSYGNCSSYSGGKYQFPYVQDEKLEQGYLQPFYADNILISSSEVGSVTGICGEISYVLPKTDKKGAPLKDEDYTKYSNLFLAAKKSGLQSMIDALDPIAQDIVKQAKPDADNVINLDPDNYVIYKDETTTGSAPQDVYFSKIRNKDKSRYLSDNLTYKPYINITAEKYNQQFIWPNGTMEMLSAATSYQLAVATARTASLKVGVANTNTKYDDAKKNGWILAGSYYTLLEQEQANTELDNYFYRSIGIDPAISDNRNQLPSTAIFSYSDGSSTINSKLRSLFLNLEKKNGQPSVETLNRSLAWVYYSYPYAKLYGKTFDTSAIVGGKGKDVSKIDTGFDRGSIHEIDMMVDSGAAMLSTSFTAIIGLPLLMNAPIDYLKCDVNAIIQDWNSVMNSKFDDKGNLIADPVKDPIIKLKKLGDSMVENSQNYFKQIQHMMMATSTSFVVGGVVQAAVMMGLGFGSFWGTTTGEVIAMESMQTLLGQINDIVRSVIYSQLPMALAIIGPLLTTGITLSMYVPLIPYMLFLFGVISWFTSIIVVMFAGPLICFLMLWGAASQESPFLSQEAENFIKQMIAIFFRPALMVVGLVVGVLLARIGVDILNAGFSIISANIFTGNSSQFQTVGIMVIYTFIMMSLVNLCFSVIHLLYSEVMHIVGITTPVSGVMEEKAMQEVQGGVNKFAESAGQASSAGAQSLKDMSGFKADATGATAQKRAAGKKSDADNKQQLGEVIGADKERNAKMNPFKKKTPTAK